MTYHHPSYKASYKHDSPSYALATAGDAIATADYMTKADLPGYTSRFYSQTDQEQSADIKYDKILVNYDKEFQAIREAMQGFPLEAYIPRSFLSDAGGSASPGVTIVKKTPSEKIANEIAKAQKEVKTKDIKIIDTIIDELVIRRRRIKKREIIVRGKQAFKKKC